MLILFNTHEVRRVTELEGMWDFVMEGSDKKYRMMVPGCIEQHPDFLDKRGTGWYTRRLAVPYDTNLRLEFKGVSHTADVYLDGVKMGHHYNAFTPFSVIAKDVKAGEHELRVRVDNRFTQESALHVPNDYYTYGGITRPVAMEELGDVYIKNLHFEPFMTESGWHAKIKVTLVNLSDCEQTAELDGRLAADMIYAASDSDTNIDELSGSITLAPDEEHTLEVEAAFTDVLAWSSREPNLYLVKLHISRDGKIVDDYIDRVGFRQVKVSGKDILVNGEKIYMKGFNRHEDYATVGCAIPLQLMVQDMDLMQEMNANAVRTCHYPNDERFLDLCDERGMYV